MSAPESNPRFPVESYLRTELSEELAPLTTQPELEPGCFIALHQVSLRALSARTRRRPYRQIFERSFGVAFADAISLGYTYDLATDALQMQSVRLELAEPVEQSKNQPTIDTVALNRTGEFFSGTFSAGSTGEVVGPTRCVAARNLEGLFAPARLDKIPNGPNLQFDIARALGQATYWTRRDVRTIPLVSREDDVQQELIISHTASIMPGARNKTGIPHIATTDPKSPKPIETYEVKLRAAAQVCSHDDTQRVTEQGLYTSDTFSAPPTYDMRYSSYYLKPHPRSGTLLEVKRVDSQDPASDDHIIWALGQLQQQYANPEPSES